MVSSYEDSKLRNERSFDVAQVKNSVTTWRGNAPCLEAIEEGGTQQKAAAILGTYDRSLRLMHKYVPDKDGIVKLGMAAVKKRKKRRAKK